MILIIEQNIFSRLIKLTACVAFQIQLGIMGCIADAEWLMEVTLQGNTNLFQSSSRDLTPHLKTEILTPVGENLTKISHFGGWN